MQSAVRVLAGDAGPTLPCSNFFHQTLTKLFRNQTDRFPLIFLTAGCIALSPLVHLFPDEHPFEGSKIQSLREEYRGRLFQGRWEVLSEFTNEEVVEQSLIEAASQGQWWVTKNRYFFSSRGDRTINMAAWHGNEIANPPFFDIMLRNSKYEAFATVDEENWGVTKLDVGETKIGKTSFLSNKLEGGDANIALERFLIADEEVRILGEDNGLVTIEWTGLEGELNNSKTIRWEFDDKYGNCRSVSQIDDSGELTIKNFYEVSLGFPIPTKSILSFPGGKATRTTSFRNIDLTAKPDTQEFFLSYYGFPEPQIGSSFRWVSILLLIFGACLIAMSATQWLRKRLQNA